jgi:hypothetical protein
MTRVRDLDNRIEVNPNAFHESDPAVYIARIEDALRVPVRDSQVTVVQPDDDPNEPEYVSTAVVTDVDEDRGLIRLRVDWAGFHDQPRKQNRFGWVVSAAVPALALAPVLRRLSARLSGLPHHAAGKPRKDPA